MENPLLKACIDLSAIRHNIRQLKACTLNSPEFMAVVKADAYGHGAVEIARASFENGADWLGVARLHEAVELRETGIKAPILVFGYVFPSQIQKVAEYDIVTSVYGYEMAERLSLAAVGMNRPIQVHLKVDTGMGRVGRIISNPADDPADLRQAVDEIIKIKQLPGIDLNGLYTHFAAADSKDKSYTHLQISIFSALLDALSESHISFKTVHAANSAGIIAFPEAHFNMVRAGISLYGLYPSVEMDRSSVDLKPAMVLKSIVTEVRKVPKGFFVSYGMTHETLKKTTLASVAIGYADGFFRSHSSNADVLIKGKRAPVVGRVCMDQTMIDVGHIEGVKTGDEVVIIGSQGSETIDADELAEKAGTINYEAVSALTPRVKRIYSRFSGRSG